MFNKKLFSYKILISIFSIVLIITSIAIIAIAKRNYSKEIANENIIAHAMGSVDNKVYTNSLEAFNFNYNNGIKIFEVDLVMTKDNHLVLRHYWNQKELNQKKNAKKLTLEEFNNSKILNKYTPIDIDKLLDLLETHKDVYFILDIKETNRETIKNSFKYLSKKLNGRNKEIVNRIIPQVLSEEMYYDMKNIIDFPIVYYGLYAKKSIDEDRVLEFVRKENIFAVSMWGYMYTENFGARLHDLGAKVYVHTINSKDDVLKFLNKGVDGVYTDKIKKEDIKINDV